MFGSARNAHATIDASLTVSSQDAGGGNFNYTLTLKNLATSTSPIETLWFSWVPGLDFMDVAPTAESGPTNWDIFVESGFYYAGYSIRWTTTTADLNPGGQMQFNFTSPITPVDLAGNDHFFGYYPELESYVYSQSIEGGNSEALIAEQIPEPSTVALVGFGTIAALIGISCRKLRFRNRK